MCVCVCVCVRVCVCVHVRVCVHKDFVYVQTITGHNYKKAHLVHFRDYIKTKHCPYVLEDVLNSSVLFNRKFTL